MITLVDYLSSDYLSLKGTEPQLLSIINGLTLAISRISEAVKTADVGTAGTTNVYGEEQLALDVISDKIIQEELQRVSAVGVIASEEIDTEQKISDGPFGVVYDPLDGSSLVDVNLSVGTIFGIYKTNSFIGVKGEDMLAAGFAVYGPRTTIILALPTGVREFSLKNGQFVLTREKITVAPNGKMFAPGNLRAATDRPDYIKLVEYWMKEQYTLRYSGGMVPDINQILLKGKGIFTYPGYPAQPEGKLRLLFECAPMAYIMEKAGGVATDGVKRILDKNVERIEQRTPILIGSTDEVRIAEKFLMTN